MIVARCTQQELHSTGIVEEDGEEHQDKQEDRVKEAERFVIGWTALNVLYSHSIASYSGSWPLLWSHVHCFRVELSFGTPSTYSSCLPLGDL